MSELSHAIEMTRGGHFLPGAAMSARAVEAAIEKAIVRAEKKAEKFDHEYRELRAKPRPDWLKNAAKRGRKRSGLHKRSASIRELSMEGV